MGKLWYLVSLDGLERQGPYFAEEVRARFASGTLSSEALVWTEGMAAPAPFREVAELAPVETAPDAAPIVEYGGFWLRFAAYAIDSFLLLVPVAMLQWLATRLNPGFGGFMLYGLWAFALNFLYFGIIQPALEGTLGKRLMGLKLVRDDLSPVSIGQGVLRYFASYLSSMVFCIGYLWVAFHPRKQGWHDLMASTVVVKARGR